MVTVKLVLVALPKVFDGVTVVRLVAYIQVLTVFVCPSEYYFYKFNLIQSVTITLLLALRWKSAECCGPEFERSGGNQRCSHGPSARKGQGNFIQ
jgi:hypothetical protein